MKLKSLLLPLGILLTMLAFGACKEKPDDTPTVKTTIKLSKATAELKEGTTLLLSAILTPQEAKEEVTWESSDSQVVTVTKGLVKAIKAGEATITAKLANGNSATCKVKVTPKEAPAPTPTPDPSKPGSGDQPGKGDGKNIIYKLQFEQASYTVEKGKSIQVKAVVTAIGNNELPEGIQAKVTYSGGKVMIEGQGEEVRALVSINGKVDGMNLGKCKVKAELEGAEAVECEVEVIETKFEVPAGAKIAFEYDDELITELNFSEWDSAKWVTIVFVDANNKKLDIEGLEQDDFELEIPKVKDANGNEQNLINVGFNGWAPNNVKGTGTVKVTFKKNTDYTGQITVTVK
ncbi:Ig-like domain-containing protein [uncultured Porphyromonas sp.]|uniref:Ig-like domain-containing protein n=1 Tax=uncultured Porphyromonas sp. TaxID=159274 RepID=UPI002592660A|nr:Ig-like domain-containing protein [uncultured Porphyromonas sp.]